MNGKAQDKATFRAVFHALRSVLVIGTFTVGATFYITRRGFYPPQGSPLIYAIVMSWFIAIIVATFTSAIFKLNPRLFSLARWEKEGKVYDRTGIQAFRWILFNSPLSWINSSLYLGASCSDFERLLKEMSAAEGVHWLTCFLSIILAILCLVGGYAMYGYVMLFIRIPFDLYPIMLQRQNRGRVYRVLSRRLPTS